MNDYEKYEADCKAIRKANDLLLDGFEAWLKSSGLAETTINRHVTNIDFYINEFLLYDDATEAKDGFREVGMFLGYWFIRKAMWANRSSIKGNAASLKKFYAFLLDKGLIHDYELEFLKETIKEDMPEWLATLDRYDNPLIDDIW